ncbi:MAG: hypothetical protein K6C94_03660 [Candidatus Gastranaerophilales bacterium]|nr:hypothetical protein [Candidatus Gastranaerophilales bacterium]
MNNLFSEIFGCYYKVVTEIVNGSPLSAAEIIRIIKENGFEESCFHLLPKIENLPFIEKRGDKYYSLLEHKSNMPLTNIEKSWLKSVIQDPRFDLFAENFDKSKFDEIEPLYEQAHFKYYDKYSDGDDFANPCYRKIFRKINATMETSSTIKIVYQSPKRDKITIGHYVPLKFEFSPKDDKIRIFAARIFKGAISDYVCLNMGRVLDVGNSRETFSGQLNPEPFLEKFETEEYITVKIYNERNAIERFMVEFSTYRKNSEFDDETQTCKTKIYYRKADETEMVIKLLSFGPTLKVLGSERFVKLFKYRLQRQYELIKNNTVLK